MNKRFVSIWFHHLETDWFVQRQPALGQIPFVIATPGHGRLIITAVNRLAEEQGIKKGMVLADARVIIPSLHVVDPIPELSKKLLQKLAEWCIRFTPCVAIDGTDALLFDASGCAHLWGGDVDYLTAIIKRLQERGYQVRVGMADTIGAAWAIARYGKRSPVIEHNKQLNELAELPPASLRIEQELVERLYKLGLHQVSDFISIPRSALRRRFGQAFLLKLDQALGNEPEFMQPVVPVTPYQERLPCLEPIVTLTGIEIALEELLKKLCHRLEKEQKGLRCARLQCHRVDDITIQVEIGTNRPSRNTQHIFKLFENKLSAIEPALGIELFILEALKIEDHGHGQERLWEQQGGLNDTGLSELLDRFTMRFGSKCFHRYLPDEHYWPERSFKQVISLQEQPTTNWRTDHPRPLHLLAAPQAIEVTAPVPDYPPLLFRYKGKLHKIVRADGPERIEQEWWLQQGQHRDYYSVEDEHGQRFWLFRSGHYDAAKTYGWYLHGFFA
ncbi:Y-family DNA polymerase [Niastella populi]|uniref:Nucleotidyltransferase n=1 Tax=Niastella populi TaxID=550983 RepID=A0A1V9FEJ7_9BACT|nr:DNA polymerase Y family protein [Niastella populi]OQP56785.1 nucleotidyltransferase [Niastella populi]